MSKKERYIVLLFAVFAVPILAQPLTYNFHRVTTAEGLTSNLITSICQDKYGYIWFGNVTGVNRYNGYEVKNYENIQGDTCAIPSGGTRSLLCDSAGRLWIGMLNGLVRYNYEKDCFLKIGNGDINWVNKLIEAQRDEIYFGWNGGLAKINAITNEITYFKGEKGGIAKKIPAIYDIAQLGRELYLATSGGIFTFNLDTEQFQEIPPCADIAGKRINRIAVSNTGCVWLSFVGDPAVIVQTNTRFDHWKTHHELEFLAVNQTNSISRLFIDLQNRLWVATYSTGLARYEESTDSFKIIPSKPWMPTGIPSVILTNLFQDNTGKIWGTSRKGAFFFDPENNLFESIIPGNSSDAEEYTLNARACVESADGKLWLGTGNGLYCMDPGSGKSQFFGNVPGKPNVLQDNSVRSLFIDASGDLWIGTSKGVNRMRAGSTKIEFLGEKEGLPNVVTKAIYQSKDGTMWVANYSPSGHCYRPPGEKKFRPLSEHPVLAPYQGSYGQCIMEDRHGRIWFGLDGGGLNFFDPNLNIAKHWSKTPTNDSTLLDNNVFNLTEDTQGRIWLATMEGISVIDPTTFHFTHFNTSTGLPTNRYLNIRADQENRIWVGTGHGLFLLNNSGQLIRQFNKVDGLVEDDFTDRPSSQLKNGRFIFPTTRGFLSFSPEKYKVPKMEMPLMLSEIRVFNKPYATGVNTESLESISFPPGNNFFSLDMLALDYSNPSQIWYAYKMEPYDKNWIITHDRTAIYTAVPRGSYVFRYKATNNLNDWNVQEKTLRIRVDEHWYKSYWFWGLALALISAFGLVTYRRRERLEKAFLSLEQKALALSKEKALVQYENLTQQLNPHFLFNSLASLGSLIRFDQKTAAEFLEALSKMYRYILQSRDRETVTLQEEIEFAKQFIKLQQTRFGEALEVRFNIDPQMMDRKIVPVTLQNLLENALKHNTFDTEDPLVVNISTEHNYLIVKNNLQLRGTVETSNKQGLSRLRSLYNYLTDHPLEIESTAEHFMVRIPLL